MTLNIHKIRVSIDFWFVAVITLMLILFPESRAAVCFAMCILHEAGHLTAMLICGKKAEAVKLGYFGMKIVTERKFMPPSKEAFIAFAGPLISLIFCLFFYFSDRYDYAVINLGLAVFNLLPVTALDGGHIVSAFFPDSRIHRKLSLGCVLLLFAVGIFLAVYTKKNFTVLIVALYLLTGILCEK